MMSYEEFYQAVEESTVKDLEIYGEDAARKFVKSEEVNIKGAYRTAKERYEQGEKRAFEQEIPSVSYCLYMCYE